MGPLEWWIEVTVDDVEASVECVRCGDIGLMIDTHDGPMCLPCAHETRRKAKEKK